MHYYWDTLHLYVNLNFAQFQDIDESGSQTSEEPELLNASDHGENGEVTDNDAKMKEDKKQL